MIEIRREKTTIQIWFNTKLDVPKPVLCFERNETYEYLAELIRLRLDDLLRETIRSLRENAYHEGYDHGKNHRKRREYFSGLLE